MPPLIFLAAGFAVAVAAITTYGKIVEAMDNARRETVADAEPEPVPLEYDAASDTYAPKREG